MIFTALHRALGRPESPLSMGMIHAAIEAGVEEDADLEWKGELPGHDVEEFAKDVAAMANTRGGLIVFGVAEVGGGSSAAGSVRSIEVWGDPEQQRLRSIALSSIQPPVHGLTFHELVDESGARVVVLDVPASTDAPHLASRRKSEAFTAPIRYGAQTGFMGESQLELAYAQRRSARINLAGRLDELALGAMDLVPEPTTPWMTVTAVPHRPRSRHLGRVSVRQFDEVSRTTQVENPLRVNRGEYYGAYPKPGYRSWRAVHAPKLAYKVIELHDDGSSVWAGSIRSVRDLEPEDLHNQYFQLTIADGVWLVHNAARMLGVPGEFTVRVDLHHLPSEFFIRTWSHQELEERQIGVRHFRPVGTVLNPTSIRAVGRAAHELSLDVFNQAGLHSVGAVHLSPIDELEQM